MFTAVPGAGNTRVNSSKKVPPFGTKTTINASRVCAPTEEALDAIYRWLGVNEDEFYREIGKTNSVVVGKGDEATVIERGIFKTQIRLWSGEDCWVMNDAVEK